MVKKRSGCQRQQSQEAEELLWRAEELLDEAEETDEVRGASKSDLPLRSILDNRK